MFNNTGDDVVIRNGDETLDSVHYTSSWGEKGKSIERIYFNGSSNDISNWAAPKEGLDGTPGKQNSNYPSYDISLESVTEKDELFVATVQNSSEQLDAEIELEVKYQEETIYSENEIVIEAASSTEYEIQKSNLEENFESGDALLFSIFSDYDNDNSNNQIEYIIPVGRQFGDILFNEINFDPSEGKVEFLEFYNNSEFEINLKDWSIADAVDRKNNRFNEIKNSVSIKPDEYFLLVRDSTIFSYLEDTSNIKVVFVGRQLSLNNTEEELYLFDTEQKLIDSVFYTDDWHESYLNSTKDRSLEKISPNLRSDHQNNWRTSVADFGSTPGKENSFVRENISKDEITIEPNPFSPFSSKDKYCIINYKIPFETALIDATVFNTSGIEITTLERSKFTGKEGAISWNGRDENGNVLPIGPYVLLIEATDQDTGKHHTIKAVLVLGK